MSCQEHDQLKAHIAKTRSEYERLCETRAEARRDAVVLSERFENTKRAREVAQAIAQEIQSRTYNCVASVVSRCLESVFDEPYEFRMEFVQRRGRTEVDLQFIRSGQVVDPLTASGGGVVDVASFALRLAALMLSGPSAQKVLFLDEPFKFLSACYRSRLCDLLNALAEDMGVQIIMVTHIDELKIGKIVELGAS